MATENNGLNVSEVFLRFSRRNLQASLKRITTEASLSDDRIRGQALHALKIGLSLGRDVWSETVQLLVGMSPKMEQGGYWDEWIQYLERGVELSQSSRDDGVRAELKLELGLLYKYRGDYDSAGNCFGDCVDIFKREQQQQKQAKALYRLAHTVCLQGNYDEAKRFGRQALILLDGKEEEQVYCYDILGIIAYEEWDWEAALEDIQICLAWFQNQNNRRELPRSLRNMGTIHQVQGEFDKAINCYEQAIDLFEAIRDPVHLAATQVNLGMIYSQEKQYANALALYESAERIFQKVQEIFCLAQVYLNKAQLYRITQKWKQAEFTCLKAIEYWESLNDTWNLVNTMDELGLIYAEQREYKKAVHIFQNNLDKLEEIPEHPRYDMLYRLLRKHIQVYSAKLANK